MRGHKYMILRVCLQLSLAYWPPSDVSRRSKAKENPDKEMWKNVRLESQGTQVCAEVV